MKDSQPLLVIVNGRPCTGKSHLASMISKELGIPLFAKDSIKEKLGEILEQKTAPRPGGLGWQPFC